MPATAPEIGRRAFLLFALASRLRADDTEKIHDLIAGLASALSESNPVAFMKAFDERMPAYQQLQAYVTALTAQSELVCSIEFTREDVTGAARSLDLDWILDIRQKAENGAFERRRELVRCRVERRGKPWKIVALEPLSFFAPLRPKS